MTKDEAFAKLARSKFRSRFKLAAHFQKYKKGTLHMVKRLALLDHDALVPELKDLIFKK